MALYTNAKSPKQKRQQHNQRRPSNSFLSLNTGNGGPGFPLSSISNSMPGQIKRPRKILYLMGIFFLLYWFGIRHGLGIERIPPPPLGFAIKGGRRGRKTALSWGAKGMATVLPTMPGQKVEHPIYELMERAETRWQDLLASQSTTLSQAVAQYKKRYFLDPPAGFDIWFEWCRARNVTFVDEYDQLMRDLLPHHALEPSTFIERSHALEGTGFTYTLDVKRNGVGLSGDRDFAARPKHMQKLIEGFMRDLPEGFHVRITGSDHDTGSQVLGRDQRDRAMELIKQGRHFSPTELQQLEDPKRTPAFGWFKACPLDSPANSRPWSENATHDEQPRTFIHDHLPTMDFCDFPELKRLHGAMSLDYNDRSASKLKPVLVLSKFPGDASHQITPMEAYNNITDEDLPHLGKWEDKTDNRVFWRGSTTGGYNVQRDWKESHRLRLHLMMNGPKGGDIWWDQGVRDVMVPNGKGGYETVRRWDRVLSKAYADVKLSGKVVQCPQERPELCKEIANTIEFGERIWPDQAAAFRYSLDVDGNGWSSRFHRLLSSGSPVIKMTMFPEWNMELLTPWYHYIPLKPDFSDLYDILAFFIGPIDVDGNVNTEFGHDHLARKIGEAGQRFAVDFWSWTDMQAYIFRLLLELRRLHSLDREEFSYHLPVPKIQ